MVRLWYKEAGSFIKNTALPVIQHCRPEPPPTATGIGSPVVAASRSQLLPRFNAGHPKVLPTAVATATAATAAATATKIYVAVTSNPMPLPSCEVDTWGVGARGGRYSVIYSVRAGLDK